MADPVAQDAAYAALVALHRGLPRQGPGDPALAQCILDALPPLPPGGRVVDLGCGSGASTPMLARWAGTPVLAVDRSAVFLADLADRAAAEGLADRIVPVEADFGALDWPAGSVSLIWSEGAAFVLGFARALACWRPLLAPGGLAVVSEMSWFTDAPPAEARAFWDAAYPAMAGEAANRAAAIAAGFEVLATHQLPAEAWWRSYYDPLSARIGLLRGRADAALAAAIAESEREMALFRRVSDACGYTYYVLRKAG